MNLPHQPVNIASTLTIKISERSGAYQIEASRAGRTLGPFPFVWSPSEQDQDAIALLQDPVRVSDVTEERLIMLGQSIYKSVFVPGIGRAYEQAKNEAKGDDPIRIRLIDETAHLGQIPWETMHDGQDFVSLNREYLFVRGMHESFEVRQAVVRGPIRILYVWAQPNDQVQLSDLSESAEEIRKLVSANTRIKLDVLPHATFERLRKALDSDYHIVCFAGHGKPQYLYLEAETEIGHQGLSAKDLARLIRGKPVRLLLLAACKTAEQPSSELAGFAQALARETQIPAIVAMQYEISNHPANLLVTRFFETIAKFRPLDVALAEARLVLISRPAEPTQAPTSLPREFVALRDVFAPVMYLQSRSSELFQRARNWWAIGAAAVAAVMALIALILAGQVGTSLARVARANATAQAGATVAIGQANANATAQVMAGQQTNIALSRKLAEQGAELMRDKYDVGLLLSVVSNEIADTVESQRSLFSAFQTNPSLVAHLRNSDQAIDGLSFSPDGKLVAMVYHDGTIAVWNIGSRDYYVLSSVKGQAISFSPDSKRMAIANQASGVVVWDLDNESPLQSLPNLEPQAFVLTMKSSEYLLASQDINGDVDVVDASDGHSVTHYHAVDKSQIVFSRDGTFFISLTRNNAWASYQYARWDTLTGKQLVGPLTITLSMDFASSLAVSPDGKTLLAGGCNNSATSSIPCEAGGIDLYDGEAGKLVQHLVGHQDFVDSLAIDPKQGIFASASGANTTSEPPTIIIWTLKSGNQIRALQGHSAQITGLDFSPDGKLLVSGDKDGNVMLWDAIRASGVAEMPVITATNGEISNIVYRADGKQLITMSCTFIIGNCETILWNLPSLHQVGVPLLSQNVGPSIAALRDDAAIAADSRNGEMQLWDLWTGNTISQIPGPTSSFNAAFTPDGRRLLVVSADNVASLWDVGGVNPTVVQKVNLGESHQNVASAPVFDSQGKMAALVGDTSIVLVDFSRGNAMKLPISGMRYIDNIVFDLDDHLLAVSYSPGMQGTDYQTILWNTSNGSQVHEPFANQTHSVFTSDGKYLAGIDKTRGIVIREVLSGNIARTISQKAPETIAKLVIDPESTRLAATDGRRIYLWDVGSGQSIGEFSTGGDIQNIAFSPDGLTLAVMGCVEPSKRCSHGEVTFWNLDLESWKQRACDVAGRNLTQAEWAQYIPDQPYQWACPQYPAGK